MRRARTRSWPACAGQPPPRASVLGGMGADVDARAPGGGGHATHGCVGVLAPSPSEPRRRIGGSTVRLEGAGHLRLPFFSLRRGRGLSVREPRTAVPQAMPPLTILVLVRQPSFVVGRQGLGDVHRGAADCRPRVLRPQPAWRRGPTPRTSPRFFRAAGRGGSAERCGATSVRPGARACELGGRGRRDPAAEGVQ